MRKNRAWHKTYNGYFKIMKVEFCYDGEVIFLRLFSALHSPNFIDVYLDDIKSDIILEESSGVKDMFGEEIYDGDLIMYDESTTLLIIKKKQNLKQFLITMLSLTLVT